MVFASLEFLTLFFPLFLLVYAVAPTAWRNAVLMLFSWAFYAWWSPSFLWILVGVTTVAWVTGLLLAASERESHRKAMLLLSVVLLAELLAYYKYANLVVDTLIEPYFSAQGQEFSWEKLILPIGISFIVLQAISYIVDVYRRTVPVERHFVAFSAYNAMFSQLIAGPIVRYANVEKALHERVFDWHGVASGLRAFMVGLSMKVVIADTLAPLVEACFGVKTPSMADAWLGAFAYGMQLFFDFAGYSTMAIGIGLMLGFRFPENFNAPYLSRSIQEFWRRWHMTLGSWLRDYLYVPLGGSRAAPWRIYLNLMIVMAISGLWHGADSLNFLIWGIMHGAAMCIARFWQTTQRPLPAPVGWGLTMLFVFSAWIIFRAPDLTAAWAMYRGQFGFNGYSLSSEIVSLLRPVHVLTLLLAVLAVTSPWWRNGIAQRLQGRYFSSVHALWPAAGFVLSVALLSARGASPFLYFQF